MLNSRLIQQTNVLANLPAFLLTTQGQHSLGVKSSPHNLSDRNIYLNWNEEYVLTNLRLLFPKMRSVASTLYDAFCSLKVASPKGG